MRILFVSNDPNEYDNTRECLREQLSGDIDDLEIAWEKDIQSALNCLRNETYQLIICDLFIAEDRDTAIVEDLKGGVTLLNEVQRYNIPSILIAPARTNELQRDIDDLDRCRMVVKGSDYETDLVRFCRKYLPQKIAKTDKTGYIKLTLDLNQHNWYYEIIGEFGDRNYFDSGWLEIRSDKIESLINRSCNIEQINNWEEELRDIGNTLFEEIIKNNYKFSASFNNLVAQIKDKNKIKIHFNVERTIHPVLLEALIESDCFIMLNSPVYRSLNLSGEYPLPIDPSKMQKRPINCLIIESSVGDKIVPEVDPNYKFPRLEKTSDEAKWLEDFLTRQREKFSIDRIQRINEAPQGMSYLEYLEKILKQGPWQIVHYSGHSFFQDNKKADNYGIGYLLFPGEIIPSPLKLEKFSKWLRDCKTEFVFLSSCHSSEENFVFELAKNCIPAIVGFRWNIDDDKAFLSAKTFYTHLFQNKLSIENAFFQTRKDMHSKFPTNRIWASPILVMQGVEYRKSA